MSQENERKGDKEQGREDEEAEKGNKNMEIRGA